MPRLTTHMREMTRAAVDGFVRSSLGVANNLADLQRLLGVLSHMYDGLQPVRAGGRAEARPTLRRA